jgi:hypothetical protein
MNAQPKRTLGLFLVPLHHRGLDVLGRSECMALERFLDGAERKSHTQWKFRPVWGGTLQHVPAHVTPPLSFLCITAGRSPAMMPTPEYFGSKAISGSPFTSQRSRPQNCSPKSSGVSTRCMPACPPALFQLSLLLHAQFLNKSNLNLTRVESSC